MNQKEIQELLKKARRSLSAAERLLRDGDNDFAVSGKSRVYGDDLGFDERNRDYPAGKEKDGQAGDS